MTTSGPSAFLDLKEKGVQPPAPDAELRLLQADREQYDMTPEQSDNESECGVSDYSDEDSQSICNYEDTSDEEDSDEEGDDAYVSPLGLVFAIIEDEVHSKDCPTSIEEEHPWTGMDALRHVADSSVCDVVDLDEEIPLYFEDSEDELEHTLDLKSPGQPLALYSLYKMASDAPSLTQQKRTEAIEKEEKEGWNDMAALAQVALHHHSPYENLVLPSGHANHRSRQAAAPPAVAPAPAPAPPPAPPSSDEALRAPSAARRAEMLCRTQRSTPSSSWQPVPPPSARQQHPPSARMAGDEEQCESNASSSSASSSSSSSTHYTVPGNHIQRLRGIGAKGILRASRDVANERVVLDLLGMDQSECEAARLQRDRQVQAQIERQRQKAQECEVIFNEVMRNLQPSQAMPMATRTRSIDRTAQPHSHFVVMSAGKPAPPPMPRLGGTFRGTSTLRRSDGVGATLKGQKVKLCPLKSESMRGTKSEFKTTSDFTERQ